jgi:O-antigen/teichoic acid export membrane protein
MMLIVSTFDFAWRPFFLNNAGEPDAKHLFARVLTYFFLVMTGCFLLISFFIADAVTFPIYHGRSLIAPEYWSGLSIVPIVLAAYIFLGIANTMVAGIYIEKQTKRLPLMTFVGAAVNVIANLLLIPSFGITGAAVATLLSYAAMAAVLYVIVQRVYPVEYEFVTMAKIALAAALVFLLFQFVHLPSAQALWKVGLLFLFGVLVYAMKVFSADELRRLKRAFTFGRTPPPGEL